MPQYIRIANNTTLSDLSTIIGATNIEYLLAGNNLTWQPNVGQQFYNLQQSAINDTPSISWQRKSTLLNGLTDSTDVFETAALLSESGWKVLSSLNTLPNTLRIPDTISVPASTDILGDGVAIGRITYEKAMEGLQNPPHMVDPSIFNEYSTIKPTQIVDSSSDSSSDVFQYFKIPWGEVTLYSSMDDNTIDFPVYPEEVGDNRQATYTTMPEMLYQYEPWYVYTSSGPRANTYKFSFHRQMWTGNEADGKSNELIRFCQAQCYMNFIGSAIRCPQVTLYIGGSSVIHGIVTDVTANWDGPLLSDNWYAHCELSISITEIAEQTLTYDAVRSLPTIG